VTIHDRLIEFMKTIIMQIATINLHNDSVDLMVKKIGVGGVSQSGKSSLAKRIKDHFTNKKVLILSQDEFVKEEKDIPRVRDRTDWEHPDSIDIDRLLKTIWESENSFDLIIVEGILAFWFSELNKLYDHRILVSIDKETFFQRRKKETRWGEEPEWFWEHVWESHLKYGQNSNDNALRFSGEVPVSSQTFREVVQKINS